MKMKRPLMNGAGSTKGREYVITMPATSHTASDLKLWRLIRIPVIKFHVKVRYDFFL